MARAEREEGISAGKWVTRQICGCWDMLRMACPLHLV